MLNYFYRRGLDAKKENWEKDFRLIVQAAQVGTTDYPVSDTALTEFTQVIRCLLDEAESAKRQHFRDFKFNQALCTELNQLLDFTEVYQKQFELEEEKNRLEKQVKHLQGTIEEMKQDKRETDAKHAQDLADLTAKYEAKGEKDRSEIRAEFEQNKSEMVERMNKIMDLLSSQQQTSTSDTQTQESSNASCRLFKP